MLGLIIGRLFTCSNEEYKIKKQRVLALVRPISMGEMGNIYQAAIVVEDWKLQTSKSLVARLARRRPSSPLSFLQVILPILWTRGPGQMIMVN